MTYFAITTMSTVGFGDFHPRSNVERAIGACILFIGVAVFSYIMGNFSEILSDFLALNEGVDHGDELTLFFGLMKRYNSSKPMELDLKRGIEIYFDYRWNNDRNLAVSTEEDYDLFKELPIEVKLRIYTDFLFNSFIKTFKKFLQFPKDVPQKLTIDGSNNNIEDSKK